jgi:hypothetical protein
VAQLQGGLCTESVLVEGELHALGFQTPEAGIDPFDPLPSIPPRELSKVLVETNQLGLLRRPCQRGAGNLQTQGKNDQPAEQDSNALSLQTARRFTRLSRSMTHFRTE